MWNVYFFDPEGRAYLVNEEPYETRDGALMFADEVAADNPEEDLGFLLWPADLPLPLGLVLRVGIDFAIGF